jgi:hypothetical protein
MKHLDRRNKIALIVIIVSFLSLWVCCNSLVTLALLGKL